VSPYDLVIFDCDGVLVDSERPAVRPEAEILAGLGWPLSESEVVERFAGRFAGHTHQEIEHHQGRRVDWEREKEVGIDGIAEWLRRGPDPWAGGGEGGASCVDRSRPWPGTEFGSSPITSRR